MVGERAGVCGPHRSGAVTRARAPVALAMPIGYRGSVIAERERRQRERIRYNGSRGPSSRDVRFAHWEQLDLVSAFHTRCGEDGLGSKACGRQSLYHDAKPYWTSVRERRKLLGGGC